MLSRAYCFVPSIQVLIVCLVGASVPALADDILYQKYKSAALVDEYWKSWSHNNNVSISFLKHTYSDPLNFYGAPTALKDVIKIKEDYVERWPERLYSYDKDKLVVDCNDESHCEVKGLVNWVVQNRAKKKRSSGSAEFSLRTELLNDSWKITSESGRVVENIKSKLSKIELNSSFRPFSIDDNILSSFPIATTSTWVSSTSSYATLKARMEYWRSQVFHCRESDNRTHPSKSKHADWDSSAVYTKGGKVLSEGNFYQAIRQNVNSKPSSSPADWQLLSMDECEDGDMTMFNGLLCASGDAEGCDAVKRAQGPDGRWWRSPRHIGDNSDQISFSEDQSFGVFLYLAETKDRDAFYRWLDWISKHRPCWIKDPFSDKCAVPGWPRFCDDNDKGVCGFRPLTCVFIDRLQAEFGPSPSSDQFGGGLLGPIGFPIPGGGGLGGLLPGGGGGLGGLLPGGGGGLGGLLPGGGGGLGGLLPGGGGGLGGLLPGGGGGLGGLLPGGGGGGPGGLLPGGGPLNPFGGPLGQGFRNPFGRFGSSLFPSLGASPSVGCDLVMGTTYAAASQLPGLLGGIGGLLGAGGAIAGALPPVPTLGGGGIPGLGGGAVPGFGGGAIPGLGGGAVPGFGGGAIPGLGGGAIPGFGGGGIPGLSGGAVPGFGGGAIPGLSGSFDPSQLVQSVLLNNGSLENWLRGGFSLDALRLPHGLPLAPIRQRGFGFSSLYPSQTQILVEAGVTETGFPLHKVGIRAYLLQKYGMNDSVLQQATSILAKRQKRNAFFEYLAAGKSERLIDLTLDSCPSETHRSTWKFQWTWERSDEENDKIDPGKNGNKHAWDQSTVWECVFAGNLVLTDQRTLVSSPTVNWTPGNPIIGELQDVLLQGLPRR